MESDREYIIYVDLDGVLANFNLQFAKISGGLTPDKFITSFSKNKFWNLIDDEGEDFWSGMLLMPGANEMMKFIYDNFITIRILTASTRKPESKSGKRKWVRQHFPFISNKDVIVVEERAMKAKYANDKSILIDDMIGNIENWKTSGGIGILHTDAHNTIKQLSQYV